MEEQRRWCQQKQEDKRRDDLNHELFSGYRRKRSCGNRLKQPAAQHKEARQAKNDKYSVIAHPRIVQTEMADMRKHDENHRESSHRIDILNSLCRHFFCKSTEKRRNTVISSKKLAQLTFFIYFCKVKSRIGIIALLVVACIIALTCLQAPIVTGSWTKQTIFLWFLNHFHVQASDAEPSYLLIDDDSGEGVYTIKRLCDEMHTKATFAVIPARISPAIGRALSEWQEEGFGIAIHGYNHDDWRGWSFESVQKDIEKSEETLQALGFDITKIKYVVPPHGGNSKEIREAISEKGYQMITSANILNPDTTVFQYGRLHISRDTDLRLTERYFRKVKEGNLFIIIGTHSSEDDFSLEKTKAVLRKAKELGLKPI